MVSQAERRASTIGAILAAARKEFTLRGFAAATIDDIAKTAGVAKGAVYHHFKSKEEIFERVLDSIQAELAAELVAAAVHFTGDALDRITSGALKYMMAIVEPDVRRILLIDGPAVLGWHKWREIDQKHFGRLMSVPFAQAFKGRSRGEIEAISHLLAGAITEAALVCATAKNPKNKARELAAGFRDLLAGVLPRR